MNQDLLKNKTKLTINNKTFFAENNQTILQACEKIGLYIPRFCYNEALSIAGNCRMCLIEIENSPKLMPACAIKIANNMKIYTKTNIVKKARESILEFLLINHPLDCPICDQGGECDLQDQAMVYGSDRGRFYEYKRSLQDKNAGPLIKTIMTRCIHCTRCIRYATEIAGIQVYGTTGRGKSMEVGTYISNLFNSEISGNVIDLCPVGALTSKPYAFTVRPWELKNIESIDVFDAMGSNIRIDTRGSEIMRILPKSNNKINQQWISDKTRFAYDGLKCQRLYYPMVKQDSKFISTSWEKAIKLITQQILKTDKKKIGGFIGNFTDQETVLTLKKFLNQIGSNNFFVEQHNGFITPNSNTCFDFRSNFLSKIELENFELEDYDTILLIGSNPRYEASMLNVRLRQSIIKKKENKVEILSLGNPLNLTFDTKQIDTNLVALWSLIQGKNIFSKKIMKSKMPISILSNYITQRKDGKSIQYLVNKLFNIRSEIHEKIQQNNEIKLNKKRKLHTISNKLLYNSNLSECNNFDFNTNISSNILHSIASIPGTLDLGFASKSMKNMKNINKNLNFLIGADSKKKMFNDSFIVYLGHHGCDSAKKANIILPSTSFIEKKGTYVNIQGFVQQTQPASISEYEIYNDWQIIQNIASNLNLSGIKNKVVDWKNLPTKNNNMFYDFVDSYNTNSTNFKTNLYYNKKTTNKQVFFQSIIKNVLDNFFNFTQNPVNNSRVSENYTVSTIDYKHDFSKNFETIAPHLNFLTLEKKQKIYPFKLKYKKLSNMIGQREMIYKTLLNNERDNFYLSDIITKSSITMGKCSALFKTHNFNN